MEIVAGIVGGIVSSLGMGGGTILIVCLSLIMGIEQHIAQATNIVFFVPTAIVAIIFNTKHKLIKWKIAVPIAIIGIFGAIIGAKVAMILETEILKKFFGVFLGIIAIYEIISMIKEYKNSKLSNTKNI